MSDIAVAAILAAAILLASMVSVELGLSVALIELLAGVIVGNAFHIDVPGWLSFIGSFAGILLTFLAGAEVDVPQLRREWKASSSIGLVSFGAPFVVVGLLAYYGLGWNHRQAEIAGIALSTTSLAVVYAVLVETGLSQTLVGKRLMAATFVTDFATVTALSILFLKPTVWIVPFVVVSIALIVGVPRSAPWFFSRFGDRVIEPEIKLVFACLFLLSWLGGRAHSQPGVRAWAAPAGCIREIHRHGRRPFDRSRRPQRFISRAAVEGEPHPPVPGDATGHEPNAVRRSRSRSGSTRWPSRST